MALCKHAVAKIAELLRAELRVITGYAGQEAARVACVHVRSARSCAGARLTRHMCAFTPRSFVHNFEAEHEMLATLLGSHAVCHTRLAWGRCRAAGISHLKGGSRE
eukprot:6022860-Prymnesium_polylepis.3